MKPKTKSELMDEWARRPDHVWRCDRCGKIYDWYKSLGGDGGNTIRKVVTGEHWEKYAMYGDDYELCPSCMAKLNDWLKGEQK